MEASVHRSGWDQPGMRLHVVYEQNVAETNEMFNGLVSANMMATIGRFRSAGLVANPMISTTWVADTDAPSWDVIRTYVSNVAYAEDEQADLMRQVLRVPGIVAFAVTREGWLASSREVSEAAIRRQVRIPDVVGSKEFRSVVAATADGKVHILERIRGEQPTFRIPEVAHGEITTSLRILWAGVHGDAPQDQEEFDRRFPSLEGTVGAYPARIVVQAKGVNR